IIRWGTTAEQETLTGTLADIVAKSQQRQLTPPALLVVGEVVRLREKLRWFDVKPLFGKRIVVTRAREQAGEFVAKLEALGAEVIQCPVIKIAELESYSALDMAISYLREYHWLIFTSVNGVDAFFKRLNLQGKDVTALVEKQVCAIGPATAQRLRELGVYVDFVPERFVAESVAEGLKLFGIEGKRVLLPRALEARETLPQMLEEMGARVDVVPAYRTVLDDSHAELIREQLLSGNVDFITFTSSSTVRNFVYLVGREILEQTRGTFKIASIGPITSQTARALGLTVDVEAREFTVDGLVEAMVSEQ
ncbi:MAG: uroporphyrinogen-III synthase, partial [Abditibacteriales bacterium]|nr:uroporphyrinogen-III synthase [Abditibacteriales bacterium]MDW8366262.1 uroporphyrinogen-III synthase [Abditibacteriales bacterium]